MDILAWSRDTSLSRVRPGSQFGAAYVAMLFIRNCGVVHVKFHGGSAPVIFDFMLAHSVKSA
eukprot:3798669-Karenia_brevis.AAC.1